MKKVFLFACIAFLAVSCTLYMDEEDSILNDDELPVYTGEGYDEVVHVQEDNLDAYYQYNSNVRHFSDDMQSHIIKVKSDPDELFTYIDFDKNTPIELLPVKGDILVSLETDHFPEGFGNHVLAVGNTGDFYRCLTCVADMKDIFKTFNLKAELSNPDATGPNETRSGDDEFDLEDTQAFHETFHPKGDFSLSKGPVEGKVSFDESKNSVDCTFGIQVEMGDGMFPNIKSYTKVESNWDFDVTGTLQGEVKIKEKKNILPSKARVKVGYVLIKFVLGFKLMFVANASVTGNIKGKTFFESTPSSPKIDGNKNISEISNMKNFENEEGDFKNDFDFSKAVLSGSIGFRFHLSVGVGLYTKSIGLRYQPYFYLGFQSSVGGTTSSGITDIGLSNALEFIPNIGHEAVLMLDLNLERIASNVIGSFIKDAASLVEYTEYLTGNAWEDGTALKEFSDKWEEYSNYLDDDGTLKEDKHQTLLEKLKGPWAISFSLGEKTIEKFHWTKSWYPKIDDSKLRISRITVRNDDGTTDFQGSYKLSQLGYFTSFGKKYYPRLAVFKGKELIDIYKPVSSSVITNKTSLDKEYIYKLKGLQYESDYIAYPCYSDSEDGNIKWMDKGLPFSSGNPLFSVILVTQDNCDYSHMSASTSLDGKEHDAYIFEFSSITSCRGTRAHKVTNMGIEASWKGKNGSQGTTSQDWPYTVDGITYGIKDGEYTNGWRITTIDDPQVDLTLTPWMDVVDKETGVKTHIKFTPYNIQLSY
ncbi:MAG: hypothetical protein IKX65_06585 [Prevotella sp.]|nr:hypothetical protein [Prevotella sp.]